MGFCVLVGFCVFVGVNAGVALGEKGVAVAVAVGGTAVGVSFGTGVAVGGTGVAVVGKGVGVGVNVKVGVFFCVQVAVGDAIDVAVRVGLPDGEAVGEADLSTVGLAGAGVRVVDGTCVGGSVLVIGAVGGSLKQALPSRAIDTRGQTSRHLEKAPHTLAAGFSGPPEQARQALAASTPRQPPS